MACIELHHTSNFNAHQILLCIKLCCASNFIGLRVKFCCIVCQTALHCKLCYLVLHYVVFEFYYIALQALLHYIVLRCKFYCAANSLTLLCDFVVLCYEFYCVALHCDFVALCCELYCITWWGLVHCASSFVTLCCEFCFMSNFVDPSFNNLNTHK